MSRFKTKDYSKPEHVKIVYGGGKKQSEENIIKSIRNFFKIKKENEGIKDRINRDIRTLFQQENDYYKSARLGYFDNNNHIDYEGRRDRNKNLLVKEYLDKNKPYSRDIIINLQKFGMWKIQLIIKINFISSKDVDEERLMRSKSGNIEFMLYDNANEVVAELFQSLHSRYSIALET